MYIHLYLDQGCSVASRDECGQRVFGLDIRVLARVMVSACAFGARVPLTRACWVGCLAVCLRACCVVRVGLGCAPGLLLVRSWPTPRALLAHAWCAPGPLLVRSWPTPGALLAHSWCAPGSLLVRSWCAPGSLRLIGLTAVGQRFPEPSVGFCVFGSSECVLGRVGS